MAWRWMDALIGHGAQCDQTPVRRRGLCSEVPAHLQRVQKQQYADIKCANEASREGYVACDGLLGRTYLAQHRREAHCLAGLLQLLIEVSWGCGGGSNHADPALRCCCEPRSSRLRLVVRQAANRRALRGRLKRDSQRVSASEEQLRARRG